MDLKIVSQDDSSFVAVNSQKCNQLSCAHLCLFTPTGPTCTCAEGFSLDQTDKKSCSPVANYRRPSLCNSTQFECRDTAQCIDKRHVCDGEQDCYDNSDEDSTPGGVCGKWQKQWFNLLFR